MDSRSVDETRFTLTDQEVNAAFRGIARQFTQGAVSQSEFIIVEKKAKRFVLCPLTKDAQSPSNEAHLEHVMLMLTRFCKEYRGSGYTLLFPLRLCRGHFYLSTSIPGVKNFHYILGELDVDSLLLRFHDSQARPGYVTYPDKFLEVNELNGRQLVYTRSNYAFYGQLSDQYFFAPYYAIEFAKKIIAEGHSENCATFKLDLAIIQRKEDYLNRYVTLPPPKTDVTPEANTILSAHRSQSLFLANGNTPVSMPTLPGLSISV